MIPEKPLTIASRQSPLAQRQARLVREMLARAMALSVNDTRDYLKIETFLTQGDKRLAGSLAQIGGKGLFTKEIEQALLLGEADIAVHSMKDMPAEMPDGLVCAATPVRENPLDAFISPLASSPWDLPENAIVGTASVRRAAQVLQRRPDLRIVPLRGNVGTRLRKLEEGQADATFLAEAGLQRLENDEVARTVLEAEEMLPAVGQGVLCVQVREGQSELLKALKRINCPTTELCSTAERAFLVTLDGSCQTPIAGLATLDGDTLTMRVQLLSLDGKDVINRTETVTFDSDDHAARLDTAQHMGSTLAREIYDEAPASIRDLVAKS
jgi:hydroxymethylbilane synthase